MQHRMAKLGVAGASAITAILAFAATPASADYAPGPNDVVGVGSDTLQYAGDFVADGSYTGSAGFNTGGNKYKVVNFDATPDANARLAYGPAGVGTLTGASGGSCSPGTGTLNGTGNQTAPHGSDKPCQLNPTITIQEGVKPIQRPNGSGAGAKALAGDTTNGTNYITYSRASSCQDTSCSSGNPLSSSTYDVLKIGSDPLDMLESTTTNAVPLSNADLANIYKCTYKKWSDVPNYSGSGGSDYIIPIIPQVGSGTRSSFESTIGISDSQVGSCVETGEENDPTAIDAAVDPSDDPGFGTSTPTDTTPSKDAIEPMSGGRLNLFNGVSGATGNSFGLGGYFLDPTCPLLANGHYGATTNGTTGVASDCPSAAGTPPPAISTSDVQLVSSSAQAPSGTGTVFGVTRSLYIYFRASAVDTNVGWQPGSVDNQIRTLFYNPCDAYATANLGSCVTVGGQMYGPGGQPYYAKSAGQTDIAAAGINPTYVVSTSGANGL